MCKPTLQQQIEFIRGARHLVANGKRDVVVSEEHGEMLMAIEENLRSLTVLSPEERLEASFETEIVKR